MEELVTMQCLRKLTVKTADLDHIQGAKLSQKGVVDLLRQLQSLHNSEVRELLMQM